MDQSSKDSLYFLTNDTYNCPFCKRNNVLYKIIDKSSFNESEGKEIFFYRVRCSACENISIHFSIFSIKNFGGTGMRYPEDLLGEQEADPKVIDDLFFWHKPNSFFILDESIPLNIRKLFDEGQSCLDGNFLVGASGCIRKMIYSLLYEENCIIEKANGLTNYEQSFEKLKQIHPNAGMLEYSHLITHLMSDNLHEGGSDRKSKDLKFILGFTKDLLWELYVIPNQKKEKHASFQRLLNDFGAQKKTASQSSSTQDSKNDNM